jgi:hypothetical protein
MTNKLSSPRWSISQDQWRVIGKQVYKYFLIPLALIFLYNLQAGKGFRETMVAVYFALIDILINFISKFVTETK